MYTQHYDFEYSDIGFFQEESLMSPVITVNQLSFVKRDIITTNQDAEEPPNECISE